MAFRVVLPFVVFFFCVVVVYATDDDFDIRHHFGTKTAYWSEGNTTQTPPPSQCSAIHVDLVARHGVRSPTSGNIASLNDLAAQIQKYSAYINNTYSYIKNWTNPFPLIQAGLLSYAGEIEHYNFSKRLANSFYPLLSQEYFPNVYVIQSTQVSRAGVSAVSFAYGLTEGKGAVGPSNFEPFFVFSQTASMDLTLRFFDNCPRYSEALKSGLINETESVKCQQMNYGDIATRIGQTLGVWPVWNISSKTLDSMYSACSFEVAVWNKTDGWCSIFTPDEIQTFEYCNDLSDYYLKGYGVPLSYEISSPLLQDIVKTMDGVIRQDSDYVGQLAYLRFAHAETVIPLVALLGLFKDSKTLTANSPPDIIEGRQWRTSIISPFTGNVMFVLYNCSGSYQVKLLHNEVEYAIPGCGGGVYCDYGTFKSLYAKYLSYDFTKACALSSSSDSGNNTLYLWQKVGLTFLGIFVGGMIAAVIAVIYIKRIDVRKRYMLAMEE